jgi:hypothetical protein
MKKTKHLNPTGLNLTTVFHSPPPPSPKSNQPHLITINKLASLILLRKKIRIKNNEEIITDQYDGEGERKTTRRRRRKTIKEIITNLYKEVIQNPDSVFPQIKDNLRIH